MIDPNVRVAGGLTFSGFEDVIGELPDPGDRVVVREPESGITGIGTVTQVNFADHLIYLNVDWSKLAAPSTPEQLVARLGLGGITFGTTSPTHTLSRSALLTA
jgi:hypothetical protein